MAVAHRTLGAGASCAGPVVLLALSACSVVPPAPAPAPALAQAPPAAALASAPDPSVAWRSLIVVPFGSERQSLQSSLHEVWFFRDDADAGGKFDAEACYSSDSAAPRFVGRVADHYFLCFRNDRLNRIQAVVTLPNEAAADQFRQFCDAGLKEARPTADSALTCEGQGGGAAFRARLEPAAEDSESELSIVVTAAALPD
ncbi:MAG TPA: hypothetical protein VKG05_00250 [Steroidobacteraceae bacterium]|nr:hypothetical protein [Steroidobacteraceae bacterium]